MNPNVPSTTKYQQHKPSGLKIKVVNRISETANTYIYRGEDCIEVFLKKIREIEDKLMKILKTNKQMTMSKEDKQDYTNASTCYICNNEIVEND